MLPASQSQSGAGFLHMLTGVCGALVPGAMSGRRYVGEVHGALEASHAPTEAFLPVDTGHGRCSLGDTAENPLFHHLADVTPILAVFNYRPTARRKPDYEPAENTDEAQKKFGNVKAISSDMYFGRQAQADVSVQRVCAGAPPGRKRAGTWEPGEEVRGTEWDGLGLCEAPGPRVMDGVRTQTQAFLTTPPHCSCWRRG